MPAAPTTPPIVAVVGATASGKTELSLDLAERLGGEIVNTDAMQLYRGMDIGTAKLPPHQRRGIPHHLLDTLDVTRAGDGRGVPGLGAGRRRRAARQGHDAGPGRRVGALHPRGARPLRLPGHRRGGPGALGGRARPRLGPAGAAPRLAEQDPAAAAGIRPENGRRIVRALEVIELTGKPFTASLPTLEYVDAHTVQIGVDIDRATLRERIRQRVDAMFDAGFVDEVERLLTQGLAEGRTASRAIGYREVAAYLRGELTEEQAREQTTTATRRFARRQDSWFRKDPRVVVGRARRPQRTRSRHSWRRSLAVS